MALKFSSTLQLTVTPSHQRCLFSHVFEFVIFFIFSRFSEVLTPLISRLLYLLHISASSLFFVSFNSLPNFLKISKPSERTLMPTFPFSRMSSSILFSLAVRLDSILFKFSSKCWNRSSMTVSNLTTLVFKPRTLFSKLPIRARALVHVFRCCHASQSSLASPRCQATSTKENRRE